MWDLMIDYVARSVMVASEPVRLRLPSSNRWPSNGPAPSESKPRGNLPSRDVLEPLLFNDFVAGMR